MSGTSLDGMDAALVRFDGPTRAALVAFAHRSYTPEERHRLETALEPTGAGARSLALLHTALGDWATEAVELVLGEAGCSAETLDFIGFHGQTVWHEPPRVTWQLGEPGVLAERFGVRVVSNFRARDVAAGGEGAPLVPMADVLLFGAEQHPRALLNIGGMANVTFVARRAVEEGSFAFDTGPGVAIVDAVARLADPTLPFDRDGQLARRGTVNETVLAELLADPWFEQPPPRSTGRERYGTPHARMLVDRLGGAAAAATAVAFTADSIGGALGRWLPGGLEVVASGGGCHHPVLWERLGARLTERGMALRRFDELFFSGDAKEAVAFALLGYLTIHGQPGNLPRATGARGPRVLGSITPA